MNIAIRTLPEVFDPISVSSGHHVIIFQSAFQTLVRFSEEGEIQSSIATSWEYMNSNKDIKFKLAEVYFSNGKMLTSLDVAFSISRHVWPTSLSLDKEIVKSLIVGASKTDEGNLIQGIEILNEKELIIHLNKPYPAFLPLLSIASFSIISKNKYPSQIIGTGPFRVKNRNDKKIELHKNNLFNLEHPKSEVITFLPYKTQEVAKKMIENDEVDMVFWGTDKIDFQVNKNKMKILKMENPVFVHMFTASKKGFLESQTKRKQFKQLVSLFCKNSVHKNDGQEVMTHLIPKGLLPTNYYSNDEMTSSLSEFDVKSKERYRVLISKNAFNEKFGEEIKFFFEKRGILFDLIFKDSSEFIKDAINSHDYDLVIASYAADFPDIDGILPPLTGSGGWIFGNYDHAEFLKEVNSNKFNENFVERNKKYVSIIHRFEDKSLIFPMFSDVVKVFYKKELNMPKTNFRYEAEFWKLFWNVE